MFRFTMLGFITEKALKKAFAKWRLLELTNPEQLMTKEEVDEMSPEEYGEVCAEQIIRFIEE